MKIARKDELRAISRFVSSNDSGFTFLRGRRRVGKTWLLKEFQSQTHNCFYFMGADDSDDQRQRRDFAEAWSMFSNDNSLLELSDQYRSWQRIFRQITEFAKETKNSKLIILLDEIQWIAKKNSGFISKLKEAWVDWQGLGNVKVIICGSSNKFFSKQASGNEDILRGIKTSASIWVNELSISEVKKYYLNNWSISEVCLTYMMIGGSPYYLETIKPEKGFIHSINDAIFISDTIFLEEVNQVLNLEFNASGLQTSKKIPSALGQEGASFSTIANKTGMPNSTLSHAIDRLIEYEIIFKKVYLGKGAIKNNSPVYYMRDFYLNFYFNVLEKFSSIIKNNFDQLIFTSKTFLSSSGYFMPNFSGRAFELLCERQLLNRQIIIPLKKHLLLKSLDYKVGSFRDKNSQIDLVVEDSNDRISRVLECKWIDKNNKFKEHLNQLENIKYTQSDNFLCKKYLLPAYLTTPKQRENAAKLGIMVLSLEDLFDDEVVI